MIPAPARLPILCPEPGPIFGSASARIVSRAEGMEERRKLWHAFMRATKLRAWAHELRTRVTRAPPSGFRGYPRDGYGAANRRPRVLTVEAASLSVGRRYC